VPPPSPMRMCTTTFLRAVPLVSGRIVSSSPLEDSLEDMCPYVWEAVCPLFSLLRMCAPKFLRMCAPPPKSWRVVSHFPLEDAPPSILGDTVPPPPPWEGQVWLSLNSGMMSPVIFGGLNRWCMSLNSGRPSAPCPFPNGIFVPLNCEGHVPP